MVERHTRREFVRRLGAVLGASALVNLPEFASATVQPHNTPDDRMAVVESSDAGLLSVRVEKSSETMKLPAKDFPPAWAFQAGDRVVITEWPHERMLVARPNVLVTPPAPPVLEGDRVAFGGMAGEVLNDHVRSAIVEAVRDGGERHGLFVEMYVMGAWLPLSLPIRERSKEGIPACSYWLSCHSDRGRGTILHRLRQVRCPKAY